MHKAMPLCSVLVVLASWVAISNAKPLMRRESPLQVEDVLTPAGVVKSASASYEDGADKEGEVLLKQDSQGDLTGADEEGEVSLKQDSQGDLTGEAECSMVDVFGGNQTFWPSTFAEAKNLMEEVCIMRDNSQVLCEQVLAEHFSRHISQSHWSDAFSMTPEFCKESLLLLELDAIHHDRNKKPEDSGLLEEEEEEEDLNRKALPSNSPSYNTGKATKKDRRRKVSWKSGWTLAKMVLGGAARAVASAGVKCFPSDATVSARLQNGTVVARTMEHLHAGEEVLTQTGFSRIFAFMDHDANTKVDYVRMQTASGHELSVSANHIIFAHTEQSPVLAGSIAKGDLLWITADVSATFLPSRIVSIVHTKERGFHAPLTEHGTLVVDGVLSSSFAGVESLRWGQQILVTGHSLNKLMHEPLRLACSVLASLCSPEWHSAEGRHAWTQFILDHFGFLADMNGAHSDIQAALMNPSVSSLLAVFTQIIVAGLLLGSTPLIVLLGMLMVAKAQKGSRSSTR